MPTMTIRLGGLRRGVAQPGRAPGSGPGGRRFKSSLPDHLFSARYADSKLLKIPAVGKNATLFSSRIFFLKNKCLSCRKIFCALVPTNHKLSKPVLISQNQAEKFFPIQTQRSNPQFAGNPSQVPGIEKCDRGLKPARTE
jgi:hypothetical protein